MTLYVIDNLGIYTEQSVEKSALEGRKVNEIPVAPPALSEGEYAQWDGFAWVVLDAYPEAPVVIPAEVTMRQVQLALDELDALNAVEAAIDLLPEPTKRQAQIEWKTASVVERSNPMIAIMQSSLSWTDEQVNTLFTLASTK